MSNTFPYTYGIRPSFQYTWDVNTLDWVRGQQSLLQAGTVVVNGVSVTNMIPAVETGLAKDASLTTLHTDMIASQPRTVSGTITANAGTNLNTSALALSATQTDRTQKSQVTDGTRDGTVKAASTLPAATDTALVVTLRESLSTPVTGTFWQSTQPVSGTFWQATQPVSGTVTANAGTNLNTSALALSATQTDRTQKSQITDGTRDGTVKAASTLPAATDTAVVVTLRESLSTPVTGAFWQSTQPISIADGSDTTLGAKTDAKSTATDGTSISAMQVLKQISAMVQAPASTPVTGAFWQNTQPVSLATAPTTPITWNGTAPPVGAGTEATALKVTLATDSTGQVKLAAGTAAVGTVIAQSSSRSDTFTATGNGTAITATASPFKAYAIQVVGTGAVATTWDVRLEGSLDGTNYDQIMQHTNTTGNGKVVFSGSVLAPALYFRSRVAGLVLGLATNVVVTIVGIQ